LKGTEDFYEGSELEGLRLATNYYTWLCEEFRPYLRGRCLEIGAGRGTFSKFLLETDITALWCLEPAANLIPLLRSEVSKSGKPVKVIQATLAQFVASAPEPFDCLVCVNVLEHIEDDSEAMRQMNDLLKAGGHLCLFVPALPWLYGSLDAQFGHYRRYTKRRLEELARQVGFAIEKLRFFNLLGVITWFLMGKILRWRTWNATPVAAYDRLIIPFLRRLERRFSPPLGQSLLMVVRREP
jgi:SAM-dependent methyltransferase